MPGQQSTAMAERLKLLSQTGPDTDMGRLLRRFWQPVAVSHAVKPGAAMPLRVMGEDLTLYRGEGGRAHLVGGRCAHRLTVLHTGWVQGDAIRCIYHGWTYDGTGQCTEAPAEGAAAAARIRIVGYPVHEYGGLIFAYMGGGEAPAFDLPRKPAFEQPDRIVLARIQVWPCNWFQMVENSLDAVHVSFVHLAGKVGPFGEAVTAAIPKLDYSETDAGVRQVATRSPTNVRVSDWSFPNNNHIVTPGRTKDAPWVHRGVWNVPVDDTHTYKVGIYAIQSAGPEQDRATLEHFDKYGDYNPADHHDELFLHKKWPEDPSLQLTPAQDYVAMMGQGAIVDRSRERLGKSDAGILLLRKIFWRELEALRNGGPTKAWRRLEHAEDLSDPGAREKAPA
ncbi:MAG: 5,5-dehydrodivanillate O-demethylase oxygenase subunit [Alphaproteobacteria bacterium]|nr:5,5-dehydrodivanillate O-demethylase oxygenase subunit [Alphaproteobacteria bacterium]